MKERAVEIHDDVRRCLIEPIRSLRRRARLFVAVDGAVMFVVALVVLGLAQLLLDRWLRFSADQRVVLNLVITGAWAWVLIRYLLRPLLSPLPDHVLATAIDRAHPQLHDQLSTAVQFAEGQAGDPASNSPELVQAVIEEACRATSDIRVLDVLNHRRARARCGELAGLVLFIAVSFWMMHEPLGIWFKRNWLVQDLPWPQATYIEPVDFDENGIRRFPRGDDLEIRALNRGRAPRSALLSWKSSSGRNGRESMTRIGDSGWEVSLGVLSENMTFRISGGDERTREFTVIAIDRPRLNHARVQITPPAYTGLAPVTLEQQTVIELMRGARVELDARLNKPVARAALVGSAGEVGEVEVFDIARARLSWDAPRSGAYALELTDRDGWQNRLPVRFTFRVVPDEPPDVQLVLNGVGDAITPQAQVPVTLSATDAYGLSRVTLFGQRDDEPPFEIPIVGFTAGQRSFDVQFSLAVATTGVMPEQTLRVWIEAADIDPTGPNVRRHDPITLRVLSVTDFLAALGQREFELRKEFERLISAQRGLSDAIGRLLPDLPPEARPAAAAGQQLAALARRQDTHARRTHAIGERFEMILKEMRTNKIGRSADERRISERIVSPLDALATDSMPEASSQIAELRRQASAAWMDSVPEAQMRISREMRAVLASMLEWEGFREAVALLNEIIEEQAGVRTVTSRAMENQLDLILGLEEEDEDVP